MAFPLPVEGPGAEDKARMLPSTGGSRLHLFGFDWREEGRELGICLNFNSVLCFRFPSEFACAWTLGLLVV